MLLMIKLLNLKSETTKCIRILFTPRNFDDFSKGNVSWFGAHCSKYFKRFAKNVEEIFELAHLLSSVFYLGEIFDSKILLPVLT